MDYIIAEAVIISAALVFSIGKAIQLIVSEIADDYGFSIR